MDTSAVSNAAQSTADAAVAAAGHSALPKDPIAGGQASKPAESTGVALPLQVAPETYKPADTPAATVNGADAAPASTSTSAGVNGADNKFEPLVPEENKQADTPAAEKPASSSTGVPPITSEAKQTDTDQDDGVKNATDKPTELNGSEDKDVDLKDAPLTATASDSAENPATSVASVPGPTTSDESTNKTAETGEKRKADTDATNGAAAVEEPAEKKQKSTVEKVVDKAKEVVEDVKEKAGTATSKDNGPARKASKRGKKDAPPVGRTERKTRSQARLE